MMTTLKNIFRIIYFATARRLPFLLKMYNVKPISLTVAVTNRCNSRCVMCNYWKNDVTTELGIQEMTRVFAEAQKAGVRQVTLYGGEPFIRKDIFDIVKAAKDNKFSVGVITNALLIDKEMAEKIVKSGIESITLSLDAVGKLNDEIRGVKGAYENTVKAILYLKAAAEKTKANIEINVAALVMSETLGKNGIMGVARLCEAMDLVLIPQLIDKSTPYFSETQSKDLFIKPGHMEDLDAVVDKLLKLRRNNYKILPVPAAVIKFIKKYFRNAQSRDVPCLRGMLGEAWLDTNGDLHTCAALPPVGNIKEKSYDQIVNSKGWKDKTVKMFKKDCPGCSCNYAVNVEASFSYLFGRVFQKLFLPDIVEGKKGNAYYYQDDPVKLALNMARYDFALKYVKEKRVLDLGCGARKGPLLLAEKAREVIGVDISLEAIEYAVKNYSAKNVKYEVMDAEEIKFADSSFETVVSFEVIEHLIAPEKYLKGIKRVLVPGGVAVLSTPNLERFAGEIMAVRGHIREYTRVEFKELLEKYFSSVEICGIIENNRVRNVAETKSSVHKILDFDPFRIRRLVPESLRRKVFGKLIEIKTKLSGRTLAEEINKTDYEIVGYADIGKAETLIAVVHD